MEEEIFNHQIPSNKRKDHRPTYSDTFNHDHYVSQFLNINDIALDEQIDTYQEPLIEVIPQSEQDLQQIQLIENKGQDKQRQEIKRSSFHNFQKHLVTTIRTIVDLTKIEKNSQTMACKNKIWKVFINSKKINKNLVIMTLGDLTSYSNSMLKQYGFKQVIRQFKPTLIRKSQIILNEQVTYQLTKSNLQSLLQKRRIKNKNEFIVYFKAFMNELINEELDKRMTKCTKLFTNKQF